MTKNTGLDVNYYLVEVPYPKRLAPYTMEVEDVIEALNMTFAEGIVLKALIRSCVARQTGVMKAGYDGIEYDSEKMVYYSQRRLAQVRRQQTATNPKETMTPENTIQPTAPAEVHIPYVGIDPNTVITLNDYQRLACRTAPPGESLLQALNHCSLGLATEIGEFAEGALNYIGFPTDGEAVKKHMVEELGDTGWYVAYALAMLDRKLCDVLGHATPDEFQMAVAHSSSGARDLLPLTSAGLSINAGRYTTEVKRAVIYGRTLSDDAKQVMVVQLTHVMTHIAIALKSVDVKLSHCLQGNIDKLRIRFPDKFSAEAAEARADKGGVDARNS